MSLQQEVWFEQVEMMVVDYATVFSRWIGSRSWLAANYCTGTGCDGTQRTEPKHLGSLHTWAAADDSLSHTTRAISYAQRQWRFERLPGRLRLAEVVQAITRPGK